MKYKWMCHRYSPCIRGSIYFTNNGGISSTNTTNILKWTLIKNIESDCRSKKSYSKFLAHSFLIAPLMAMLCVANEGSVITQAHVKSMKPICGPCMCVWESKRWFSTMLLGKRDDQQHINSRLQMHPTPDYINLFTQSDVERRKRVGASAWFTWCVGKERFFSWPRTFEVTIATPHHQPLK